MRSVIIIFSMALLMINSAFAINYYYAPMNFQPQNPINHEFNITEKGEINITLPQNFTLVSGSLTGNDSVSFVFSSPTLSSDEPEVFVGSIYVNGTLQENYYMLYANDDKIVDLKIEIGHGDFNYIDPDDYIGAQDTLLFNIVRVWAMGSDVINEPATDVRFNCTFPDIIPNTVDSKYTTTYNVDNITALGELGRMEGMSLFRVFVLSQQVDLADGESYNVTCDKLYYDFPHTRVVAEIPDISLEADSLEPLLVSKVDGDGSVFYTILNNGSYDIRNIQFLFDDGNGVLREELDELMAGETVSYTIEVDVDSDINVSARFIPSWMFNSRAPSYLYQQNIGFYVAPNPATIAFSVLNTCDLEVCAEMTIANIGSNSYDYTYYYWTSDSNNSDFNDPSMIAGTFANKVLAAGEIWATEICIQRPLTNNTHYLTGKVDYGEFVFSNVSFTNDFGCREYYSSSGNGGGEDVARAVNDTQVPIGREEEIVSRSKLVLFAMLFLLALIFLFGARRDKEELNYY